MRKYILQFCLILIGSQTGIAIADDIYKCIDANGKTRFSENPCGEDAEKVELKQSASGVNFTGDESQWDSVKYANKAREVNRELEKHEETLSHLQSEKAQVISDLRYQQQFAAKNIVGKRYEKKLENEIKRVARDYDRKIKSEKKMINDLKRDLEQNWR